MALGLLDIKRRIRSVKNTQKITKAVSMVATSKFGKIRARLYRANPYFQSFKEAMDRIISSNTLESPYLRPGKSEVDIYIVITSDSGLCGNYNANVINKTLREIRDKQSLLITVGERGRSYFTRRGFDTVAEYVEIGNEPSNEDIREIVNSASRAFTEGRARNVFAVYTRFISPVKQEVEIIKVLPLEGMGTERKNIIEFDPSPDKVFEYVLPQYLNALVYFVLANGIASEFAIRIRSMDGATKNASDLLNKLQVMYNKARQSSITQEITEIVSGAEALKD